MRIRFVTLLTISLVCSTLPLFAKSIALSFDDAPTGDSVAMTGAERTRRLIEILQQENIPEVGIFAIGQAAQTKEGATRLPKRIASCRGLRHSSDGIDFRF